ncbi:di-trans,poly-cis-decaprenylcistransferase [Candidatus Saccharibacteria bacterium]|nr:di-trans,poly-cis-decaprenylcistransferase [Candidatus Saccharibacteria bacterium]MCB9834878.1 di-trans,poly-cis-decaprenylcistransferase [Candidatus Nomurabacteria bacterium]
MNLPSHIAFILDGHRRWARANGKPALFGHQAGYDNFIDIATVCYDQGIKVVSAYAFSQKNWKRSQEEVGYLMRLFAKSFSHQRLEEIIKRGIRIIFVGRRSELSSKLVKKMEELEQKTKDYSNGILAILIDYDGRAEILDATKRLAESGQEPTEDNLRQMMWSSDIPDPDLIVRTSGEQRLSGFWLWGSSYSELAFIDKNWPDFNKDDLSQVLENFNSRERRYGGN